MELAAGERDIIYDRFGAARLRLLNDGRIVTWNGRHMGFLVENAVYNYSGEHIGWYENGILRDLSGYTVGFGVHPTDNYHPILPFKQYLPYRGYVQYAPYYPYLGYKSYEPFKQLGWSSLDPVSLFKGTHS